MRAEQTTVATHPWHLQAKLVLALVFGLYGMFFTASLIWDVSRGLQRGDPEYAGLLLALRLVAAAGVGPLLAALGVLSAHSGWFFLYRYRLRDSVLEVLDPVLRRRTVIDLTEVRVVRSFAVFGQLWRSASYRGHVLVTAAGRSVRLSEALPFWNELLRRCTEAHFEASEPPWWEPRM